VYRVEVKVVAPRARFFVVLDDPIPGGCEVVNERFLTEAVDVPGGGTIRYREEGFIHKDYCRDRVLAFAEVLPAGEHTFVYYIRPLVSGNFIIPPTVVKEVYTPEVFGSTPPMSLSVSED